MSGELMSYKRGVLGEEVLERKIPHSENLSSEKHGVMGSTSRNPGLQHLQDDVELSKPTSPVPPWFLGFFLSRSTTKRN